MNKREIFLIDDMPPEAMAMLQAMYSRDPRSVVEHLKKVREVGADKFMGLYYVGYGHKSIGDCGNTTLFIEQVSLLVAKAIQDFPLYNGQEASTRYLDMSKQTVLNPLNTPEGEAIQQEWMRIYGKTLEALKPFLKEQFPRKEDQKEAVYEKAISAKAFDIARGLLPAGVTTLLSWQTNLRQAYDQLQKLHHHPLEEIRSVADEIHLKLKDKYTNSFSHKQYEDQEAYLEKVGGELSYYDRPKMGPFKWQSYLKMDKLSKFDDLLKSRPAKTELSDKFRKFGDIDFEFTLDFGSFRDLQRHRSGSRMMPLLTTWHGFFPWYLEQLPATIRPEVEKVIKEQEALIDKLVCSPEVRQYYIAIGYAVTCEETFSLPAAIYVAELRSGQTVHPTMRVIAQNMAKAIAEAVPGIALHCDMSPDEWSIKRGTQDIVKK